MDFRGIPVSTIGPGTQPEAEDGKTISYIDMPKDMSTYQPPRLAETAPVADLDGAKQAMLWLREALASYARSPDPLIGDLSALDPDSREIVNQILCEGEVSITLSGPVHAKTQESILAGVWRTLYLDQDDCATHDLLEVADVPHYVRAIEGQRRSVNIAAKDVPNDVVNALPLLVELDSYCREYQVDRKPRTINLSLLPMADADIMYLDDQLGHGAVEILSRAYGKCQVSSTLIPNVWWVRYYNSMNVLILDTLEVVDVPHVACAAPEDLHDSALRLDEILAPYWSDVA